MKLQTGLKISIALMIVLSSCRGSSPVIDELDWRLMYRDNGTSRFEELSLFLRISDPDGAGDLALITVSAGDTGLIWRFPESAWLAGSGGGKQWTGLPAMIPLSGFRLPDAVYTVRLEDLAGHGYELTFRPDPGRPAREDLKWPVVRVENGLLRISGVWPEIRLVLRDDGLVFRESVPVRDGEKLDTRGAVFWELWVDDGLNAYRMGPYLSADSK